MALLVGALGAAAPVAVSQTCDPADMFLAPTFTQISSQTSVSLADLDGDGDLDSVSTRPFQAGIVVDGMLVILEPQVTALLNNGAADPTVLPLDSVQQPEGVRAADFDGDGIPDLAVASGIDNGVGLHLGLGDGTFAPHVLLPCATPSAHVAVADVDANGTSDVIAGGWGTSGQVFVLRGLGDGTFLPAAAYATGDGPLPISVDVNGDGALDIVSTNFDTDDYSVLVNQGDGTYLALPDTPIGNRPLGVAAEDLDGDGVADLVVAVKAEREVQVLLGHGDGSFSLSASYSTTDLFSAESRPTHVAIWDANGDAWPDLAVACSIPFKITVSVMLGSATGVFTPGQSYLMGSSLSGSGYAGLEIGDVDGDGAEDIVLASQGTGGHSVYVNGGIATAHSNGDGSLDGQPAIPVYDCVGVSAADLDGDGVLDLVASSGGSNGEAGVSVALGLGEGEFGAAKFTEIDGVAIGSDETAEGIETADLDGDGNVDVVVCVRSDNRVFVYLGLGDGTLSPPTSYLAGSSPRALSVADFNEDGVPDLAVIQASNTNARILLGAGDGSFILGSSVSVGSFTLAVADFDGDGHADLAAGGQGDVGVAFGQGDGSFGPAQFLPAPEPWTVAVTAADFNGDGFADLASATQGGVLGGVGSVFLATGLGTFQPALGFSTAGAGPGPAFALATGDLDGDGVLDLVLTHGGPGPTVLRGQGDGTFGTPQLHSAGGLAYAPELVDLDGDGMLDMLLPNVNSDNVMVLLNQCTEPNGPWTNLGDALAGVSGPPALAGTGTLLVGEPATIELTNAAASAFAVLFIAITDTPTAFKGGTLHPIPIVLQVALTTDVAGAIPIAFPSWPSGLSGLPLVFQYGIVDASAIHGVALSNALRADVP